MSKFFQGNLLFVWTISVSAFVGVSVFNTLGIDEESIRLNIRYSARISLVLFSFAFIASSLLKSFPSDFSRYLMKNRRVFGLSFGISHLIHLAYILMLLFIVYDGDIEGLGGLKSLAPSIAIYLYIFLMMLTSNNYSMKMIGVKYWTWMHRLGMYFISIGLAVGFYKVLNVDLVFYGGLLIFMLLQFGLRIYSFLNKPSNEL